MRTRLIVASAMLAVAAGFAGCGEREQARRDRRGQDAISPVHGVIHQAGVKGRLDARPAPALTGAVGTLEPISKSQKLRGTGKMGGCYA